jgi:AcrR family transcriptional regulator
MQRPHLTRIQSKNRTRHRLLDAGQIVIVRKGFAAASVEDLAAAAGFTRGAFYSNFSSKTALFLDLLQRDQDAMVAGFPDITNERTSLVEAQARLLAYYCEIHEEYKGILLWEEAKLLAARDRRFGRRLCNLLHQRFLHLSACIRQIAVLSDRPLPLPADSVAKGLLALRDSLQLSHAIDVQHVPREMARAVLTHFFARIVFGFEAVQLSDPAHPRMPSIVEKT